MSTQVYRLKRFQPKFKHQFSEFEIYLRQKRLRELERVLQHRRPQRKVPGVFSALFALLKMLVFYYGVIGFILLLSKLG